MDQSKMAGMGNVYSDEILFQAGINPRIQFSTLDEDTIERLYHTMKEVLKTAIERQAVPEDLPNSYIIPHRHRDGVCPKGGRPLERVKVSGRTAYYCPHHQGKEP